MQPSFYEIQIAETKWNDPKTRTQQKQWTSLTVIYSEIREFILDLLNTQS